MNLQKVTIENFKCFKSKSEIDFGKITLLTGANSSGKSSIIYSILGAIQSGEFPFHFSTNGKYVNMGDYKNIVFNNLIDGKIKFSYEFKNITTYVIETVWIEDKNNNLPKLFELKASSNFFNFSLTRLKEGFSIDYNYEPQNNLGFDRENFEKFYTDLVNIFGEVDKNFFDSYSNTMKESIEVKGLVLDDIDEIFNRKVIFTKENHFALDHIFFTILHIFENYLSQINFISSFRHPPERTYLEHSRSKLEVNNYGDGYLDQIIYWESKNKPKFNQLIKILKDLKLINSIRTKRLDGGRFEIAVQIKEGGIYTSLSDVGFGLSQFLPIIVADLQLPDESTLFVAQPEIHLHPSVQSSFGGYLVNQVKTNSKNYVIETHSEYLLNKIRLAVVKGEIDQNDVKVLFIEDKIDGNEIHKITFNTDGQILNAPNNFFKTYMMDVMEIAIQAAG